MQSLKKLLTEKGLGVTYWSLHKLKHKGIAEAENNRLLDHVSEQFRNRYGHKE